MYSFFFAQYETTAVNSYTFPNRMAYGDSKHAFTLNLAKLPKDAVEESSDIIYAPLFSSKTKIGIGKGFYTDIELSTNFITYHAFAGLNWTWNFGRLNLAIGAGPAYFIGEIKAFGFDSKVQGILGQNHYTMAYAFDKFTLALKLEQSTRLFINQFADNINVSENQNINGAFSFSLALEQAFWKDNFLSIEVKANITRFYYPTWIVFSSYERYNFIPEVIFGISI